jgi:exodeoxyribonuclease VII large subunit
MTDNNIKTFTVSELSNQIKTIVSGKKFRVCGEVSQPKISNGHLYFSLKDINGTNIKSIIWKSKNIDKTKIEQGQKVTIDGKLDYYDNGGNVNLIVDKILIEEDMGTLFKKYEDIKMDFTKKGYFNSARKKVLPKVIKNIIIITSANGAALQDFLYTLNNNNSNITYEVIDVVVQGIDCPSNICSILNNKEFSADLIIITRGGGSFEDLFGFSQPELIESVYNFKHYIPILSAIGHMVDNPLLDLVADVSTPTPSLAAQYIVDHNKNYINKLYDNMNIFKLRLLEELNSNKSILIKLNEQLYRSFNIFNRLKNNCMNSIKEDINKCTMQLNTFKLQLEMESNNNIVLYNNNKKICDSSELIINNTYKLRWGDKEFNIKIII